MERDMKKIIGFAAMTLACAGAAPSFAATTIQDGYVQAGVSDYGTVGSNGSTEPGILYDPTGSSNYGNNDFLTPGDPFEGYYVTGTNASSGNTFSFGSNNDGSRSDFGTTSPTALSPTSATWTGTSTDGSLQITNTYALSTISGQSVIGITTTLTALTGNLTGVQFLRTLDPDPDVYTYGDYATNNTVLSADQSCGTGTGTGQTICIYSNTSYTHQAGVSSAWSTDPAAYLAGLNDGNGDYTIGMGFSLGDIAEGQSDTFTYDYVLGGSLTTASAPPPNSDVPEPAAMTLLGAGLAGIAAVRRRC